MKYTYFLHFGSGKKSFSGTFLVAHNFFLNCVKGKCSCGKAHNRGNRSSLSIETGLLIRTLQKWVKVFVDIVLSSLISFSQVGVDHQTISLLWSARAAGKKCHTGCGVGIIYTLKIIC